MFPQLGGKICRLLPEIFLIRFVSKHPRDFRKSAQPENISSLAGSPAVQFAPVDKIPSGQLLLRNPVAVKRTENRKLLNRKSIHILQ